MSSIVMGSAADEITLVITSEYVILKEGQIEVKREIHKELVLRHLHMKTRIAYIDAECSFVVHCPKIHANFVCNVVYKALASLIKKEQHLVDNKASDFGLDLTDDSDDGENASLKSKKIKRRPKLGQKEEPKEEEDATSVATATSENFPETIRSFKFKDIWSHGDLNINLDLIISDSMLQQLIACTECQLVKDFVEQRIYLGAHSEQSLLSAVHKLDIIHKYHGGGSSLVSHHFYTEGFGHVKAALKPVKKINGGKRYVTTIIDTMTEALLPEFLKLDYKKLKKSCTLSCYTFDQLRMIYVPTRFPKFLPAVAENDKTSTLTIWNAYVYPERGVPKPALGNIPEAVQGASPASASQGYDELVTVQHVNDPSTSISSQADQIERWAQSLPIGSSGSVSFYAPKQFLEEAIITIPPRNGRVNPSGSKRISASEKGKYGVSAAITKQSTSSWDNYSELPVSTLGNLVRPRKRTMFPPVRSLAQAAHAVNKKISSADPSLSSIHPGEPTEAFRTIAESRPANPASSIGPPSVPWKTTTTSAKLTNSTSQPIAELKSVIDYPPLPVSTAKAVNKKSFPVTHDNMSSPGEPLLPHTTRKVPIQDVSTVPEVVDHTLHVAHSENLQKFSSFDEVDLLSEFFSAGPTENTSSMNLVDALEPTPKSKIYDGVQQASEFQTRIFHNTMNQKAPKPHQGTERDVGASDRSGNQDGLRTIDPQPEFDLATKLDFYKLLERLRGFRGQVVVKASLGRIVLSGFAKHLVSDEKSYPINCEELKEVLNKQIKGVAVGPWSHFTRLLSTLPADMKYIVDLRNKNGDRMWEPNYTDWDVFYDIQVHANNDGLERQYVLQIHAEKFTYVLKAKKDIGSMYLHCTQRDWDAYLTAEGFETHVEEEYDEFAKAIMNSLVVKPSEQLELNFETPISPKFFLGYNIRVHRVSYYTDKAKRSILHVTEVEDYLLETRQNGGMQEYRTQPLPLSRGDFSKWHEVSISSTFADKIFQQNRKLQLGEEADWTLAMMESEDIASDIITPALSMIKRMDGVGYWNDNGHEHVLDARPVASQAAEFLPQQAQVQYW